MFYVCVFILHHQLRLLHETRNMLPIQEILDDHFNRYTCTIQYCCSVVCSFLCLFNINAIQYNKNDHRVRCVSNIVDVVTG